MQCREGLVLYHGSYTVVREPDLSKCAKNKDFGQGFYLTTSLDQARSFARLSTRKAVGRGVAHATSDRGYVSRFAVSDPERFSRLSVLEFESADSAWLRCIVAHRRPGSFPGVVKEFEGCDVIIGKIANDQTNIVLTLYMDGVFGTVGTAEAESACIGQLLPERLKDQWCLRTPSAISCLMYEGSEAIWM